MSGLSLVRMISHVGVRLMVRHGGGGPSTDGWQDKSAAFGLALMGWLDWAILPSRRTPLPALPIDIPNISTPSAPSPTDAAETTFEQA
jgi:hypothetical protein